ncbi:MAG: VCBS repeat-containing protein, partial [Bacteroidetes bacterium]|nr:VCBS repeat-containing protein [Bacteroidota bacterium]
MKVHSVLLIIVFSLTTNIFSQVQFTSHTITTDAFGAVSVFAIDVDGDGDMDVLSASSRQFENKIDWYENDGNENFTSHTITTDVGNATSVYAADVDGDGDMDVLSASSNDHKIAWYENDGNENFTSHTITTDALLAHSVYAIDVDGD